MPGTFHECLIALMTHTAGYRYSQVRAELLAAEDTLRSTQEVHAQELEELQLELEEAQARARSVRKRRRFSSTSSIKSSTPFFIGVIL
eukprot:COSAG05_NODE_14575_length_393_cov_0.585034_1_plen_88_part_00